MSTDLEQAARTYRDARAKHTKSLAARTLAEGELERAKLAAEEAIVQETIDYKALDGARDILLEAARTNHTFTVTWHPDAVRHVRDAFAAAVADCTPPLTANDLGVLRSLIEMVDPDREVDA